MGRRFELNKYVQYVQWYCRGGGAAGEQSAQVACGRREVQCCSAVRCCMSAYIVGRTANAGNPSNRIIQVRYGWVTVSHRLELALVCSVVRRDGGMSHVCV